MKPLKSFGSCRYHSVSRASMVSGKENGKPPSAFTVPLLKRKELRQSFHVRLSRNITIRAAPEGLPCFTRPKFNFLKLTPLSRLSWWSSSQKLKLLSILRDFKINLLISCNQNSDDDDDDEDYECNDSNDEGMDIIV